MGERFVPPYFIAWAVVPLGRNVRTLAEAGGTILFCGKDVAEALGYKDTINALKDHCRGVVKRHLSTKSSNRHGSFDREVEYSFITEPDLYRLIVASKLPSAQKFEREFVGLGIFISNDRPVVSSRDIARVLTRDLVYVLRDIQSLKCPESFGQLNFEPTSYTDQWNREKPEYLITRDGFTLLVMGFTGEKAMKWKIKYIEA